MDTKVLGGNSMSEVIMTCPLGSKCREIKDNKQYKCMWLTKVEGRHPVTGETVNLEQCAIAVMPLLQIDTTKAMWGNTGSLSNIVNLARTHANQNLIRNES